MSETKSTMVPVSEWGKGVVVSLSTVARRWGLSEDETLELFGLIPMIGLDDGGDGEVRIRVAETDEVLWVSRWILVAEGDFPELGAGQGCTVLAALRALKSAVEGIAPGMYCDVANDLGRERGSVTA